MVELTQRCEAGIARRFPGITGQAGAQMRARLEHELRIIGNLGFASYFLTVAEVSRMILDMGVRAAARGSQPGQRRPRGSGRDGAQAARQSAGSERSAGST